MFLNYPALIKSLFVLTIPLSLLACGSGDNATSKKNGQSIVRVNDEEITVHQVNFQMQRMNVNEKNKEAISKQVVNNLVERQILVQQAMKAELDKNPQIMQALEESKMQLLARAYLESKMSGLAKPTDSEITDYRNKHPELFENRKLYAIEEMTFVVAPNLNAELEKLSDTAKSLEDVSAWLDANQIKFNRNKSVRAAEAIPGPLLLKISQLNIGELLFVRGPNNIAVAKVLETKAQPVGVTESKPIIERIIMTEKQRAAASQEMERLRKASKIEFLDKKFESTAQASAGNVVSGEYEKNTSGQSESPTEPTQKKDGAKVDSAVEKGLSGL